MDSGSASAIRRIPVPLQPSTSVPNPPPGTGTHDLRFQPFALDTALDVAPGADRDTLPKAMHGHVPGKAD